MNHKTSSRRAFVASGARVFFGSLLGFTAWAQVRKNKRLADDPNCTKVVICQSCGEFKGCIKTKASEARSV